jgi:uncharacterized protein (TIGR02145 family)
MSLIQKKGLFFVLGAILLFLSCVGSNNPAPTTGTIQGMVTNATGSNFIVGASVSTEPPTSAVGTDAQGNYTIGSVTIGQYTVVASKAGYNPDSVTVTVRAGQTSTADIYLAEHVVIIPLAPSITTQPQSQDASVGQSVTFRVTATGTAPISYQWYKGGTAIPGATSSSYSISNVQTANAGIYTVTVSNGTLPNATSSGAVFSVVSLRAVTDIDGNVYSTVTIGTQVWMGENLKTTRYNDGTAIPLVTDSTAWGNLRTPGYCWYLNDSAAYAYLGNPFGALYNWYAVNTGKLAPTGWHVPTDAEWSTLASYLGGDSVAGGALKASGGSWASPNTGATDETGFNAYPNGERNNNGTFNNFGFIGYWWSATAYNATFSLIRIMGYSDAYLLDYPVGDYSAGYSVRCVRNN